MKPVMIVYFTPDGEIVRHTIGMPVDPEDHHTHLIVDSLDGVGNSYVCDGALVPLPPCTEAYYYFDYTKKRWEANNIAVWEAIRFKRNTLLTQCDWTQLPDVPENTKSSWASYRQALRDITDQPDPFNIVWPPEPTK